MIPIKTISKNFNIAKGLVYKSYLIQIDSTSIGLMAAKCIQLMLNPDIITVSWVTATKDNNNKDIVAMFTKEEFYEMYNEAVKKYEETLLKVNKEV